MKTQAWEIPIYVQLAEREDGEWFWVINPAMALWKPIMMSLSAVLYPHSVIRDADRWVIPKAVLETVATKAPGVTPSFYLRKEGEPPTEQDMEFKEEDEVGHVDDEMIRTAWNKTRLGSLATYKAIWIVIVREIAARLLIDRKPVDLGWFKIHAIPYRTNWKFNLLQKRPKLAYIINCPNEVRESILRSEEVLGDMSRTDMMATASANGRTIFQWHLEIETTKKWEEYMTDVEVQRLTGADSNAYLKRWGALVRESRPVINRLLAQLCRAMARPAGQPIESGTRGRMRLVPYVPEKGGRPARVDRIDLPLVGGDGSVPLRGPEDKDNAFRPARKVQKLPVFQFGSGNVRDTGGDVEG